jgi:catechol 2,3-dioxygenase-like lactoylglutathione lyase family enzyme
MDELRLVLDHTTLSVSDLPTARAFYVEALAPLGLAVVAEFTAEQTGTVAFAGFGIGRKGALWLAATGPQSPKTHLCFRARTRAEVRAFYAAALHAGGTDNGGPGPREIYHPAYYAAFVLDLEGHNIEAVCFEPEADEATDAA